MIFKGSMKKRLAKRNPDRYLSFLGETLSEFRCDQMALRQIRRIMRQEGLDDADRVRGIRFILLVRGDPDSPRKDGEIFSKNI